MSAIQSLSFLSMRILTLRQHFNDVVLLLWRGPGFNAALSLPYESLDTISGQPWPVQRYRAMACARQLYVYSCATLRCIGQAEDGSLILTDKGCLALRMEKPGALYIG
jgi:mannose/cellobiose epimerase-like protein (N-acyl-D-glucosamine 2-epimerase family)